MTKNERKVFDAISYESQPLWIPGGLHRHMWRKYEGKEEAFYTDLVTPMWETLRILTYSDLKKQHKDSLKEITKLERQSVPIALAIRFYKATLSLITEEISRHGSETTIAHTMPSYSWVLEDTWTVLRAEILLARVFIDRPATDDELS